MMDRRIICRAAKRVSALVLATAALCGLYLLTGVNLGQADPGVTHTIYMNAMEVKGGTSADKLAPPVIHPKDLSKGYGFKAPGDVDKRNPKKWQVASYIFTPGYVTVSQGDTVKLIAFVINGNKHEVWITDPDGQKVVPPRTWNRGREYELQFVAKKAGTYQLVCSEHAPSMNATFLVLPR